MRQAIDHQLKLDVPKLDEIEFDPSSRHELEPILVALKHIYDSKELLDTILELIAKDLNDGQRSDIGCPGLDYWEVLVLAAVRLGCDLDYDALSDLANNHIKLRRMLGAGDWESKRYPRSTIHGNITHLKPETIREISNAIVAEGHRLKPEAIESVRGDSVVVQANIHYPTDANLIVDGVRKVLSLSSQLGRLFSVRTWQHWRTHLRGVKQIYLKILKTASRKGLSKEDKDEKFKELYKELIERANGIVTKAASFPPAVARAGKDEIDPEQLPKKKAKNAEKLRGELTYFLSVTRYVISLAQRRVINGETIAHDEKLHSLFEPHTELINRGKTPYPIEFGHRVFFFEDKIGFIVDHIIMDDGQTDNEVVVPMTKNLQNRVHGKIKKVSFDKGCWSPENLKELNGIVDVACLPKKGKLDCQTKIREQHNTFRQARQWHPGIESAIHALVAANGLAVCRDKDVDGYARYVALGVLGRNLHTLGRILLNTSRDVPAQKRRAP